MSLLFCSRTAAEQPDVIPRICAGFPAASDPILQAIRKILFYLPPFAFIALLSEIARTGLFRTTFDMKVLRHQTYAAAAYLVGPILIVNWTLKTMSGRPRPYESLPFGGELLFVPAGDFTGACMRNCSFVSGEAAAAGWLLCLLPLISGPHRRKLSAALIAISLLTPALRVMMGGHFLSDVVLGWIIGASAYPMVVVIAAAIRAVRRPGRYRPI